MVYQPEVFALQRVSTEKQDGQPPVSTVGSSGAGHLLGTSPIGTIQQW